MRFSATYLRYRLRYSRQTGVFTWRVSRSNKLKEGDVAGHLHSHGYVHIQIDSKIYKAHRLAWLYVTGKWPKKDVEHKNTNKADNKWRNLRLANDSQNQANSRRRKDNTTGLKSVCYRKDCGKWRARLQVRGVRLCLGNFTSAKLAHAAYIAAAKKHFGEFARAH